MSSSCSSIDLIPERSRLLAPRNRLISLLIVVSVILGLPYLSGFPIMFLERLIAHVDPHQYWLGQFVAMSFSLALTVGLMKWLSPAPLADWGFNMQQWRLALLATAFCSLIWVPFTFELRDIQRPPTESVIGVTDQVGVLVYLLTLCSIGQEALYRGLCIHWLRFRWKGSWNYGGLRMSHAGLISVVVFVLAHVRLSPPYFSGWQVAASAILGFVYAVLFERTNSLLGPTLIHSMTNASVVALLIYT